MEKVYFDKEKYGQWIVIELEDFYHFKAVNFQTNEESYHILSWTRNYSLDDLDQDVVRVYDVEIDEVKYYFIIKPDKNCWDVIAKDSMLLEKLLRDKNIFFTGDTLV
jgi:hypothetical protein